jgi:hypothetical protein
MAFPSKNSRLENNPDWGEKGRRKLRQLQVDTIANFGESEVGASILERLDALDATAEYIAYNKHQWNATDTVLEAEGATQSLALTVNLQPIPDESTTYHVYGQLFVEAAEIGGWEFQADVAPLSVNSWWSVAGEAPSINNARIDALASALMNTGQWVVTFSMSITLNGVETNISPVFSDLDGFLRSGSWIEAKLSTNNQP